jgi:hypothetical protein
VARLEPVALNDGSAQADLGLLPEGDTTVTARYIPEDGRYQASSQTLTVVVGPPPDVLLPDLVGRTEAEAKQMLSDLGLVSTTATERSNSVAAGHVLRSDPRSGQRARPGDSVALSVSDGPTPPVTLIDLAPNAGWRSGAGALSWNGNDGDTRGFALLRRGTLLLEDGSNPTVLETHPEWVVDGFIIGDFALPSPIIAGDHFRATIGFLALKSGTSKGAATFIVQAVHPGGATTTFVEQFDTAADGKLVPLETDLTAAAGAQVIRLRVNAGPDSSQDWAVWLAPRVEG